MVDYKHVNNAKKKEEMRKKLSIFSSQFPQKYMRKNV